MYNLFKVIGLILSALSARGTGKPQAFNNTYNPKQ